MPRKPGDTVIEAAGTVAVRVHNGETQVLLVHRPRYDDWSLPKGKLITDECLPACAVRETREETGAKVRLLRPLDTVSYEIGRGHKQVHYWRADVLKKGSFTPSDEVDKTRWLAVEKAVSKASYPEEPALIRQAVAMPASTPLLIVRHAKAMPRSEWDKPDHTRPLSDHGQRQSRHLVALLHAYGVTRLVSSTSTRCQQTLKPYAHHRKLTMDSQLALSEEQAKRDPKQVGVLVAQVAAQTATSGEPTAICGHRPVLPAMLRALGLRSQHMQPAAVIVAHLSATGSILAVEFHQPCV